MNHFGVWKRQETPIVGARVKLYDPESGRDTAILDFAAAVNLAENDIVSTNNARHYKVLANVSLAEGVIVRCPACPTPAP